MHREAVLTRIILVGKLKTVISGHMGWVRSVAVEPGNQWFATGAGDRVIKVSHKLYHGSRC
jgi:WD40 repeat protein